MTTLIATLAFADADPEKLLHDGPRFEPVSAYASTSRVGVAARPVGMLVVDQSTRCTATLVDDDLLLTNAHCVDGSHDRIWFYPAYREEGLRGVAVPVETVPVELDSGLDYALLAVPAGTGASYGVAVLALRRPGRGDDVLLVHHPRGAPKKITRYGCRIQRRSDDVLRHLCDTQPGSSGAPVYDGDGSAVVGLHRASSSQGAYNLATTMAALVRQSPRLAALAGAPAPERRRPFEVVNQCSEPIRVALRTLDPSTERWTTRGFERLEPGEALQVPDNDNRWAYYTARSVDGTIYWEAPPGEAKRNLKPIDGLWYGLRRTDVADGSIELTCTVDTTPRWLVRNRCDVPIDLTLRTKGADGWVTTRWRDVEPGETVSKRTANRVGYYHATGDGVRWSGDANEVRVDGAVLGMRRNNWDGPVYATNLTCS